MSRLKNFITCFSLLGLLFFSNTTLLPAEEPSSSNVIDEIRFNGQKRTRESYLSKVIDIQPGTTATQPDIDKAIQDLRNTNLFHEVSAGIIEEDSRNILEFSLKEKWPFLPFISVDTSGSNVAFQAGAVDFNTLGRNLMNVFIYGYYEGYSSFTWILRAPQMVNVPLSLTSVSKINKDNILFLDSDLHTESGYTFERWGQRIHLEYFLTDAISVGPALQWEYQVLDDDFLEGNIPLTDSYSGMLVRLGASTYYRNQNYIDYRLEGFSAKLQYMPGFFGGEREEFSHEITGGLFYSWLPHNNFQLRGRLKFEMTSTDLISLYHQGTGFADIRGIPDGLLNGNTLYVINQEAALTLLQTRFIAAEWVIFADLGQTETDFTYFSTAPILHYGTGVHLRFPTVQYFHFRFDFAWDPESSVPVFNFSIQSLIKAY